MILILARLLAGFTLRIFEVAVESSLYLLIGFLTAGAMRTLMSPRQVRGLFGSGRWTAPVRAWLAATTLLPVCSLGVLPVLGELRRAKVPRHAILTFALAAPMLNPISLISGISYLGPNLLGLLVLGTCLVSVGAGGILGPDNSPSAPVNEANPHMTLPGAQRLIASVVLSARLVTGAPGSNVAVGILGAGVMAAILSPSFLADSFFEGDHWAIPRMAIVAPLTYITPEQGVVAIPEMLKFRQSTGALFVFVALGVGISLGQLGWAASEYGISVAARWLGLAMILTIVLAYGVQKISLPVGTANSDNDHFNQFANPFDHGGWPSLADGLTRLARDVEAPRWATFAALIVLSVAGLGLRLAGPRGTYESFLTASQERSSRRPDSVWNRSLSPHLVSIAGLATLGGLMTVAAYAYYPDPAETFRDLGIVKADFYGELGAESLDPARHHLDLWERQVSKLQIGSLIRLGPSGGDSARTTKELLAALNKLRNAINEAKRDEARTYSFEVAKIQQKCRDAYLHP